MEVNIEPFKMVDGKLTAVKVEHHGEVEIIEIDPTPFQDYMAVVTLVKEYLQARMEHALARSKFEDARDLFAATTDKYENVQRKMKFLQLSTVQGYQPEPPKETSPEELLILSKKETAKPESIGEIAERHRREMEESLKRQERMTQPQVEKPRRIIVGVDTEGLIKKEEPTIKKSVIDQSQPGTELEFRTEPIKPEPTPSPVVTPTSAEGWAKTIYDGVISEIKRRTKGQFTDNDLIIEVTRKGVPADLVEDTVEKLIKMMQENKLFGDQKKKPFWMFGKGK